MGVNLGLLITLRRGNSRSYFRENLLALTSLKGSSLLLASGYFQEIIRRKNGKLSTYSVLEDELLEAIISNTRVTEIWITGCMSGSGKNFKAFMNKLSTRWNGLLMVGKPRKNSTKWHAKIALMMKDNAAPLCAIIGSSNLTKPAYGLHGNWNHECDVTIWDNSEVKNAKEVLGYRKMEGGDYIYFEKITDGDDEKKRMKNLYGEIMKNVEFTEYKKEENE